MPRRCKVENQQGGRESITTCACAYPCALQIDRLIQLLDTPGYTFLRLQLLQPQQHAPLLRALYALLMLLPQSNAFRSLSTRLNVS
jgi:hypothetical protein